MHRRSFLGLPSALAIGCDVSQRDHVIPSFGLPPWHMWGTSQRATLPDVNVVGRAVTAQLAKINYGRPETWSFFFGVIVLGAPNVGAQLTFTVDFDLILGVGRSVYRTPAVPPSPTFVQRGFVRFTFQQISSMLPGQQKWTTVAPSPLIDDTVLTSAVNLEHFPAHDIQCSARVSSAGGGPVGPLLVELHSYFAPRTHVRPEWFGAKANQFRGGEQGGT